MLKRRRAEDLRLQELLYAHTFERAPFAAALSRLPDGVLVQVNEAFERTFGYSRAEALGRTTVELRINPDIEDRARITAELRERGEVRDQELTLRTRSGDERIMSINIYVVAVGGQHYLLNLTQDITERRRAEIAREQMLASEQQARGEAEQAVQLRDNFLSVAAHELKTPLTSLRGQAQLLKHILDRDGQVDPARLTRGLIALDRATGSLARLVDQMLDITRIEAGNLRIDPTPMDLAAVTDAAVESIRPRAEGFGVEIGWYTPGPIAIEADPLRLEQVLLNLLENALKYGASGGRVEVTIEPEMPSAVHVKVRDFGPGIPPDRRAGLFERFYQAHAQHHISGLGLGLYISRQIVEAHGGRIEALFPADGGACFDVILPVRSAAVVSGVPSAATTWFEKT